MGNVYDLFLDDEDRGAGNVDSLADRFGVPAPLARALMGMESGGRADAVSPKGARGRFQVMPGTLREMGVDPASATPEQMDEAGLGYLRKQYDRFGRWDLALAAYHAGPGSIRDGRIPDTSDGITRTPDYVKRILGAAERDGTLDAPEPRQDAARAPRNVFDMLLEGRAPVRDDFDARMERAKQSMANAPVGLIEEAGRGARRGLESLGAGASALIGRDSSVVASDLADVAQVPRSAAQQQYEEQLKTATEGFDRAQGFAESTGAVIDIIKAVFGNPTQAARATAESLAASSPAFVGAMAGAGAGALAGPAGSVIGGLVGFLGGSLATNTQVEMASRLDEKLRERGVDTANVQQTIAALEQNPTDVSDARSEAIRAGLATTVVEGVVDLGTVGAARALKPATSLIGTAMRAGAAAGAQGLGEGLGAAAGDAAAGDPASPGSNIAEGLMGIIPGIPEAAGAVYAGRNLPFAKALRDIDSAQTIEEVVAAAATALGTQTVDDGLTPEQREERELRMGEARLRGLNLVDDAQALAPARAARDEANRVAGSEMLGDAQDLAAIQDNQRALRETDARAAGSAMLDTAQEVAGLRRMNRDADARAAGAGMVDDAQFVASVRGVPSSLIGGAMAAGEGTATLPRESTAVEGDGDWRAFGPESGSMGVPRADMPQIRPETHGPLVNFLKARGVESTLDEVPAGRLRPTQAEYSPAKVESARDAGAGEKRVLVSSDGYVVDGHHRWLAAFLDDAPVKVIRLDAPVRELLDLVREFPSAGQADGGLPGTTAPADAPVKSDGAALNSPADPARAAAEAKRDDAIARLGELLGGEQPASGGLISRAVDEPVTEPEPRARERTPAQLAAQKAKREGYAQKNPFLSFLGRHGVSMALQKDIVGETGRRGNRMIPYHGPMFRRDGLNIDLLAERAIEAGFLSASDVADAADNGGTRKLAGMILRAFQGERVLRPDEQTAALEQEMQSAYDDFVATESEQDGDAGSADDPEVDEAAVALAEAFDEDELNALFREVGAGTEDLDDAQLEALADEGLALLIAEADAEAAGGPVEAASPDAAPADAGDRQGGGDEGDAPRQPGLIAQAAADEPTPPVAPGFVRYYHGGTDTRGASGALWFSSDLRYAKGYAAKSAKGGRLFYVDVPKDDPVRGGDAEFGVQPPQNIELPAEWADQRQPFVEAAPADDFTLTGQTPEQLRAADDARRRADAERARRDAAPPPDDFVLTGSDSPADQARARGQMELGDAPPPVSDVIGRKPDPRSISYSSDRMVALRAITDDAKRLDEVARMGADAIQRIGLMPDVVASFDLTAQSANVPPLRLREAVIEKLREAGYGEERLANLARKLGVSAAPPPAPAAPTTAKEPTREGQGQEAAEAEVLTPSGGAERPRMKAPPKKGEAPAVDVPLFDTYADARTWIEEQSRLAGGKTKFRATDAYKAAFPQLQVLYQAERESGDAKRWERLRQSGAAVGDRVQVFVGGILGGRAVTGTIVDYGGRPHVAIDGKMTVSRNGRVSEVGRVPWDDRWGPIKVRSAAADDTPALTPPPKAGSDEARMAAAQAKAAKAIDDLANLLGGKKFITPEQQRKLLPILVDLMDALATMGAIKFKQLARQVLEVIRAKLGPDIADQITLRDLQSAYLSVGQNHEGSDDPAAIFSVTSLDAIMEAQEPTDAPGSDPNLERDRLDAADGDEEVGTPVPPGAAGPRSGAAGGGVAAGGGRRSGRRDPSLPGPGTTTGREPRGDAVRGGDQQPLPSDLPPGVDESERVDDPRPDGVPADAEGAGGAGEPRRDPSEVDRRRAQRAAESIRVKVGDRANIDETLPYLTDGQRADVAFAEARFAKDDGHGVLFTNGTGTGKTFTGLGIVKRFARRGRDNVLVVVPSQTIAADWVRSGQALDLDIKLLANTKDNGGSGPVITTYANLSENASLALRKWDLVVADEAHKLSENADGEPTEALRVLRALTGHRDGKFLFAQLRYPEQHAAMVAASQALSAANRSNDTPMELLRQLDAEDNRARAAWDAVKAKADAEFDRVAANRPKATFLSATPFAYEKNTDWANGYLYDYAETFDGRTGYNSGSPQAQFMIRHFGYRMRVGKLTEPGPEVDRGLMQRAFNSWMKKNGVLSGRSLDVPFDYDRRFQTVESGIGNRIDEALAWLNENEPGRFALRELINGQFDHLTRRRILEGIKAEEVVPYIRAHLAAGRKVLVFHDYRSDYTPFHPFKLQIAADAQDNNGVALLPLYMQFKSAFKDLIAYPFEQQRTAPERLAAEFPDVLLFNGAVSTRLRREAKEKFNDPASGRDLILVQSAAGREGISLHDTDGKMQRVLIHLGLPTAPTAAIQQEGRIMRFGQASDAMFRYLNTGTSWERWAFASTIARRASAAENMAQGEEARGLLDSFVTAFESSGDFPPGHPDEGKGGKAMDRMLAGAISLFERAKSFYFAQPKKNARTKSQEGVSYFATPEPLGLKMVEWAGQPANARYLEPSAGHGAIARWFPELASRTAVEPSPELGSRLALAFDGRIVRSSFEDLDIVNKYDAIVMNPPFNKEGGVGGKLAAEHLIKAWKHLAPGGRLVAIIPDGPSMGRHMEKVYEAWQEQNRKEREAVVTVFRAQIDLPTVTFERAATQVRARVIVFEKRPANWPADQGLYTQQDLSSEESIGEFFDRLEGIMVPPVAPPVTAESLAAAAPPRADAPSTSVRDVKTWEQEHSQTGATQYMATPAERVDDVLYRKLADLAKKHNGYYSRYKNAVMRVKPGFVFKTALERQAWMDDARQAMGERPAMSRAAPEATATARRTMAAVGGMPIRRLTRIVDGIRSRWANAPDIEVVASAADLPDRVQAEIGRQEAGGAQAAPQGVYWNGTVYLVADQLPTEGAVVETLLHETLGHYGLRGVFGARLNPLLDRLALARPAQMREKARDYGLSLASVEERRAVAEELLAEIAQYEPSLTIVDRLLVLVRDWLRMIGFDIEWSDADVIAKAILPARRFVEGAPRAQRTNAQAAPMQGGGERAFRDADKLTDITQGAAFREQGLRGLEVPQQRVVLSIVVGAIRNAEVRRRVVELVPVDVVHDLAGRKGAPEALLGQPPVLKDLAAINSKDAVPVRVDAADALVRAVARIAAERLGSADEGSLPLALDAAMGASEANAPAAGAPEAGVAAERAGAGPGSSRAAREGDAAASTSKIDLTQDAAPVSGVERDASGVTALGASPILATSDAPAAARGPRLSTLLRRYGQQPESAQEAARWLSDGWRVFVAHEMDEEPVEVTSVERLLDYTYAEDQMIGLPPGAGGAASASPSSSAGPVRALIDGMRFATGSGQARAAADAFLGRALVNADSGIAATVSRAALDKMLSKGVVDGSVSPQAHMRAVANLDHLFALALRRLSRPGKKAADGENVKAIHHFDAPLPFDGRVLRVKIMAKEFAAVEQGARLYLVQAVEVVDAGVVGGDPVVSGQSRSGQQTASPPPPGVERRFAELVEEVKRQADRPAFARPSTGRRTWDTPEPSKLDDFLYTLQDKQIDMRRVVQAIKAKVGQIADRWNPYLQEELYHGRTAKRVKDFLDFELRPLLTDMQMRGVALPEFEKFLHARHAEERNVQIAKINPKMPDGGSGMTTADAQAYLAGLDPAKRRAYEALAAKVDAITKGTRDGLVADGLEKKEAIDRWTKAYSNYVPLMREEVEETGAGTGMGFSVRGPASRRAMGSDKGVVDILANLAMQRERAIIRAEKNRVAKALYGLAVKNPNTEFWKPVNPRLFPAWSAKQKQKLEAELLSMGLDPVDAAGLVREPVQRYVDPRDGLVHERVNPALRGRDNVLSLRVNGEDRFLFFNATDERAARMAHSLKNLDVDQLGRVLSASAVASRWFASVNTQYNPIFGVVNLTRDVQSALFNLSTTPIAGKQAAVLGHTVSALRGIYADIRAHRAGKAPSSTWAQLWEEFQREGGQTGFRDMWATAGDRTKALESEIRQIGEGKARGAGRAIFAWLSDYNETLENATRLAAYKVALDAGQSKQQAASIAKNLTVNFNRKGQITQQAGALYAFFNASVQGTARLAETLAGPKGRKIIAGGLILGVAQAMLLAAAGFDDDDPPEFVRERNLVIPIGGQQYVTIPMPLGLHVLPSFSRITTEWVLSGFRKPADRLAAIVSMLAETFNPIGNAGLSLQTITPTVVDPLAALAENKDFTGRPIARENINTMQPKPGFERTRDSASWAAKQLAYWLNAASGGTDFTPGLLSPTPDQIDYLVGQVTGGVGRELLKAQQTAGGLASGEEIAPYKMPLVGRFYGDASSGASESARFFDNLKTVYQAKAEMDGRRRAGESVAAYMREHPESRLVTAASQVDRDLDEMKKERREAARRGATAEQLRRLDDRMKARMAAFNRRVEALQQ